MNDQELRAMIRESIANRLGASAAPAPDSTPSIRSFDVHASHGTLPLARGGDGDGACLIEPSVRCNHCGYCISYGH
jgi:hypothetical protein